MKYDKFFYFTCFSSEQQEAIAPYFSPDSESSLFKYVPIHRMEEFKQIARRINPNGKIRARFRGKRSGAMRDYTLKKDAHSVAIYVDE
jgi:hypothetical protein